MTKITHYRGWRIQTDESRSLIYERNLDCTYGPEPFDRTLTEREARNRIDRILSFRTTKHIPENGLLTDVPVRRLTKKSPLLRKLERQQRAEAEKILRRRWPILEVSRTPDPKVVQLIPRKKR